MSWAPTTEQILNLDGVRHRIDAFRFELCDRQLNPIGTLHPDRETSTPSIQNDASSNTSRRLSGFKLTKDEAADVNTMRDRLRVYMTLQNGAEFRLGTFLWADDSRPLRSWGTERNSELVDFTYILDQPVTQAYSWGRGGTIVLIMIFLLGRAGFRLEDLHPIGDAASRGLADPMSWEPGATTLQMLTDMGTLVGFAPPFFDRDGKFHFDAPPDLATSPPTVPAYDANTRIIADSIVFTDDLLSAPNDFAVTDSGTEQLRVGRYQVPASAPHSFANRGFRVGKVESVQGISSQAQANVTAHNIAKFSDVYEHVTFSSTADPRHDTLDIVPAFGFNWLETAWSMELRSGGAMQHTLKRFVYDIV